MSDFTAESFDPLGPSTITVRDSLGQFVTSYTVNAGVVSLTALPIFTNKLADFVEIVDDVWRWINGIENRFAPNGAIRKARLSWNRRNNGARWQFEYKDPDVLLTDADWIEATGDVTWQARAAQTLTWSEFRFWYEWLRVVSRLARGKTIM